GATGTNGSTRGAQPSGRSRRRLSASKPAFRRLLERTGVHCHWLPSRLLFALSRLPQILPAVGARSLLLPDADERARAAIRHVSVEAETKAAVVAVTGLAKEARIAGGPGVRAVAGGGDARRLAQALEREVRLGAQGVISFGIAGGLVDTIAAGDWLVALAIVTADGRFPCDQAWTRVLAERLPGAMTGDVVGCDAPVMEAAGK